MTTETTKWIVDRVTNFVDALLICAGAFGGFFWAIHWCQI